MLKYFVKALGFMAALVLSGAAFAVSMGDINVTTALGQPLKAEIGLTDLGKGGKSKISVNLASPEAFKEAGLEYPATLPKLKFQVESRDSGDAYLVITSTDPVNEPFVNMLIELNWPSGKLLRQYTFLLDPPGFKPEQPKPEQVQALEPNVASAPEPKAEPVKQEPVQQPMQEEPKQAAEPQPQKAMPAPVAKSAAKPETKRSLASGNIEVKSGDSLSKIAREAKPADVSLERMLVAMYRANEDQFDGHNMNRIRTGKILRMPEAIEVGKVGQVEAVEEIRAQVADWHAYRQRLAAASASGAEQAPRQEVSGKISTTVAEKAAPVVESGKDVVRLSKGEAPGDKSSAGGKAMQDKLHALEEEAIARDKMLKDSYERIAALEKNIKEMQRLLELKGQPVPPAPAETKPAAQPETAKPAVVAPPVAVSAIPPAAPVKKKARRAEPPPPPPSLLDEILGEPLYLGGIAAVLLGLVGGVFMLIKRRGKGGRPAKTKEDKLTDTGTHIAEPVPPSPDTGDFTVSAMAPAAPAEAEDVDPLKEADLFLSFGRDAQAEEILKDAMGKNPGNQEVRLKLLSIYENRKDVNKFSAIAHQVQDSGDEAAWAQAAEMGRRIDPGNPMYGGGETIAAEAVPTDESTITQTSTNLDFDLGLGAAAEEATAAEMDVPVDAAEATSSGLDFDLGSSEAEEVASAEAEATAPEEPQAAEADVMDFDLGLSMEQEPAAEAAPPEEESKAQDAEVLDFDITAEYSGLGEQKQEAEAAEAPMPSAEDLVFDVTGIHPAAAEEETPAMAEEISLEPEAEPEAEEVISLDIPMEESAAEEEISLESKPEQEPAMGLSEISLDIGKPAAAEAAVENAKDQRWHDVATKLDLARAYQEMGDAAGAKEILDEVVAEGDAQQKATAQSMIKQLSL